MDKVLRNRVKLRHTQLIELCAKATDIKNRSQMETVTVQELMETKNKLGTSISNFERELLKLTECVPETEVDGFDTYMLDQIKAEELTAELETLQQLNNFSTSVCREQHISTNSSTKLPKLELPKFNGDVLKWPEFWDKFESNVHNRSIHKVDKLSYLFSSLEDKALDALRGLDITNDNYDIALELLKNRFGNKTLVINAHFDALTKLPLATENRLRFTLDSILKHLRILESLGEDTKGNIFSNLVLNKFPSTVIYELNLMTPQEKNMQIILEALEKIVTAKERSLSSEASSSPLPSSSTEVLHVKTSVASQRKRRMDRSNISHKNSKRQKIECAFCKGGHYNDQCLTYKTYAQRRNRLQNRCFKCFETGHRVKDCKFKLLCYYCQGSHNRALCTKKIPKKTNKNPVFKKPANKPDRMTEKEEKPQGGVVNFIDGINDISNSYTVNMKSYLQTATAQIQHNNSTVPIRLLLDCGSQRSYITSKLAQTLNLNPDRDDKLLIYTFGSDKPQETASPSVETTIVTKRGCKKLLRVNIVPCITDRVEVSQLKPTGNIDIPADDDSLGERIDMLIGNDYYFSFLRNNHSKIGKNLYLVDTDLGWIMSGYAPEEESCNDMSLITYCQCYGSDCPYYYEPDLPLRGIDIKFLWSLESIGIIDSPKATREEEAVKFFNETVRYDKGRYEVKWPWIEYPPDLPTNLGLSFGRLRSLLKRADEETLKDYEEILSEQLKAGIIEIVEPRPIPPNQDSPPLHYLPHHIVKQTGKKGRIVYDASAKTKEEKSLNECMYRGPSLLEDLNGLLLKFRTEKIGITADVEKAFLQVGLQEEDRDVTRFLWVKDTSKEPSEDNLLHYRFCRVPFGVIASPFLLTATIRHHLSKTNEVLLKKIADRCYVDNLVTGANTRDEAHDLYQKTRSVFKDLSMNIRDWVSNDKAFIESIPKEYRAKECEEMKVLGLVWNVSEDTLQLKIPSFNRALTQNGRVTKKEVLRTIARVYDPCGFASPLILQGKLIFQETCLRKLKWNSPLPDDLMQSWMTALEYINAAKDIRIPRYIGINMSGECEYELHCFTDASKNAYAAVVYILMRNAVTAVTAFMMSKSRITPVEDKDDLKIPRLELLGFLIGSRLLKYVAENIDVKLDKKYLWTDSLIVLAWMKTSRLLPPFVSRRVNEIKQMKDLDLRYVPTQMNPADVATRPGAMSQKQQLWFEGPEFIRKSIENWPHQSYDEQKVLCSAGESLDIVDGPEMTAKGYEGLEDIRIEVDLDDTVVNDDDEVRVIRDLQLRHFPEEAAGKQTPLYRNLGLFLDKDRVLRCKGRMMNTDWNYNKKYPILVPKNCDFTNNVIMETHKENYHVGVSHTLSLVRQKYWIPQGRAQVQKTLKRCPQCIKHGGGPYKLPPTPALPPERVNFSSPFSFTGMDYFGPMFVQSSNTKEKRWICLFTCLAVRAIHLEVVNDLTAEECLLALRRFIASRGKPNLITSDNATQFKLTSEILADPHCVANGIRWKFIPQLAPWHGGVYERLIGLVKNCLKRTLEKHLLQDGQLLTVIKEVEAVVNTRPLVRLGSEVEHVLRPADFLSLGKCLEINPRQEPRLEGTATKVDLLKSWKRGQAILNEFRKMFHDQYLPSLRERYNHQPKQPRVKSHRSPQIGDVVQIKEDSKNRNKWKVGKITALIKGSDGECRVAKVKVGDHVLTRSVGHLYPLEAEVGETEPAIYLKEKTCDTFEADLLGDKVPYNMDIDLPDEIDHLRELSPPGSVEKPEETPNMSKQVDVEVSEGEDALEQVDIPMLEENTEIADNDMTSGRLQLSEVDTDEPVIRARREAAIRAREKIAEWTRHLLAIL